MDNPGPHKAAAVRVAVEAAGATLLYLPPDSPDSGPIEPAWGEAKSRPRSLAARPAGTPHDATGGAFRSIAAADRPGFFRHGGYLDTRKNTPL